MQAQPTFYFNKPLTSEILPQVDNYASEYINMFGVEHRCSSVITKNRGSLVFQKLGNNYRYLS